MPKPQPSAFEHLERLNWLKGGSRTIPPHSQIISNPFLTAPAVNAPVFNQGRHQSSYPAFFTNKQFLFG
jgi:hypothetical protein